MSSESQGLLLEAHVTQQGTGDVGPAVEVRTANNPGERTLHPHHRFQAALIPHPALILPQERFS
jgi:hypothetical protein